MKKLLIILLICLLLCACGRETDPPQVVATTMPIYTFCQALCQGTPITVDRLIQDPVSCLHDYTLQVSQMQMLEGAQVVIINGAGLEDFLSHALLASHRIIDCSQGLPLHCTEHTHEDGDPDLHDHGEDPHYWLSPALAKAMTQNIYTGLCQQFPQLQATFTENLADLESRLDALALYGQEQLATLSTRDIITFHDGFSYFAESFDLTIVRAIEEESGSETSAARLIELIGLVQERQLPALFTETNGSTASARVVAAETGAGIYCLDMAMSQGDYFSCMYANIDTVKEALE